MHTYIHTEMDAGYINGGLMLFDSTPFTKKQKNTHANIYHIHTQPVTH